MAVRLAVRLVKFKRHLQLISHSIQENKNGGNENLNMVYETRERNMFRKTVRPIQLLRYDTFLEAFDYQRNEPITLNIMRMVSCEQDLSF